MSVVRWLSQSIQFLFLLDLAVTIIVTYTPPPDVVDLGPNEYRAATTLNLTCVVEGATGTVSYKWMTSFNDNDIQSITRNILRPADTRTHTCTATDDDGNETGSGSIDVIVVGKLPYSMVTHMTFGCRHNLCCHTQYEAWFTVVFGINSMRKMQSVSATIHTLSSFQVLGSTFQAVFQRILHSETMI